MAGRGGCGVCGRGRHREHRAYGFAVVPTGHADSVRHGKRRLRPVFVLNTRGDEGLSTVALSNFFQLDTRGGQASSLFILAGPQSQTVPVGNTVTFSVVASGAMPLTYQWYYNQQIIPGATGASYTLGTVAVAYSGYYSVVVGDGLGTTRTALARLIVYSGPDAPQPPPPNTSVTNQVLPAATPRTTGALTVFTNGGVVDPNKMTIVLTHGWLWPSWSGGWLTDMANTMIAKGLGVIANIIAWDWQGNARRFDAASRTTSEGDALGSELLARLGTGYNRRIHFIGHSFGTMVNCRAADYIHGDATTSPGASDSSKQFYWQNTHMTLFDQAEIENPVELPYHLGRTVLDMLFGTESEGQVWRKVIPTHRAWVDNYISVVGLPRLEAANFLLWRNQQLNPIEAHGYAIAWYSNTVVNANAANPVGHYWSFERNGLIGVPEPGSLFTQNLNSDPLTMQLTERDPVTFFVVAYPTAYAIRSLGALGALGSTGLRPVTYVQGQVATSGGGSGFVVYNAPWPTSV